MATEKNSALTNRGTVLSTEMNALANVTYSAAGPEYDNTTQLDSWGILELLAKQFTSAPTLNAPIHVYAISAPDGTDYEDGASIRAPDDAYVGTFQMYNTNSADQRVLTRPFKLKPVKLKILIFNACGQTMAATLNVMRLFTFNRQIN